MQGLLVLLVEDNRDDEELTMWALKRAGLSRVMVARDGVEALAMLCGQGGQTELPDLVLLDLRLPKVDGLEVLRRLRCDERTQNLHIVALTSSEDPSDQKVCRELGIRDFLAKPLNGPMLLKCLHPATGRQRTPPHPLTNASSELLPK